MLNTLHTTSNDNFFLCCGGKCQSLFRGPLLLKLNHWENSEMFQFGICTKCLCLCIWRTGRIKYIYWTRVVVAYFRGCLCFFVSQRRIKSFHCQPQLYNFHVFILTLLNTMMMSQRILHVNNDDWLIMTSLVQWKHEGCEQKTKRLIIIVVFQVVISDFSAFSIFHFIKMEIVRHERNNKRRSQAANFIAPTIHWENQKPSPRDTLQFYICSH